MAATTDRTTVDKHHPHSIVVDSRKKVAISGVTDVGCFDEQSAEFATDYGGIIIKGRNLHVTKVNLDTYEVALEGDIDSVEYSVKNFGRRGGAGFFKRIFR